MTEELERDPPLPLEVGPVSNGEYPPLPPTPVVREATRRTLAAAEAHARRLGMDRRHFLMTLGGSATLLLTLAACSKEEAASRGDVPGGTFAVPSTAPFEPEAAAEALGPSDDEFVLDVQTHTLDYAGTGADVSLGLNFPQANCGRDDPRTCFGIDIWLDEIFGRSDTTMAVLSALPIISDPHPQDITVMNRAREAVDDLCGTGRVLLQGQANPNVGELAARLDGMTALRDEHDLAAWKVYTHFPGPSWSLDDHDPDGMLVGRAFLDHVSAIGPPVVAVHKGLGDERWASPADLGPSALAYPDIAFVAYHSGYEQGIGEGPYVSGASHRGIDRLVETVVERGPGIGRNVYAELGSTWFLLTLTGDPSQQAHALGKLLLHVGPDNILWGTDSIWYGSPQGMIETFRAFEISEQFQEEFGYPALTDEIKRKILGGNAARLYGVDPVTDVCRPTADEIDELRVAAGPPRTYGPRTIEDARALFESHGLIA